MVCDGVGKGEIVERIVGGNLFQYPTEKAVKKMSLACLRKVEALQEQTEEIRGCEEKIHHLADQMIVIDLDDGVMVNCAKFGDVLAPIK